MIPSKKSLTRCYKHWIDFKAERSILTPIVIQQNSVISFSWFLDISKATYPNGKLRNANSPTVLKEDIFIAIIFWPSKMKFLREMYHNRLFYNVLKRLLRNESRAIKFAHFLKYGF